MFKLKATLEGDGLTVIRAQPERPLILDTLAEMRKAHPMADREGLGRWALSIPMEDWLRLREKYPDLAVSDPVIKSRAYARFIQSAESLPFRVREKI
jgi:hypothetical protein